MDNQIFVHRLRKKIERLTGRSVELRVDHEQVNQLRLDLELEVPLVVLGSNIFQYAGFARMCIEYAVASIQQQRAIDQQEFRLLLARN